MRLLVCGDRNWSDNFPIIREIAAIADQLTCVIEGAARGADTIAGEVARSLGIPGRRERQATEVK